MITHIQTQSEIQFLTWQMVAWEEIRLRNPEEDTFASLQKQYCKKRIEALEQWEKENWIPSEQQI